MFEHLDALSANRATHMETVYTFTYKMALLIDWSFLLSFALVLSVYKPWHLSRVPYLPFYPSFFLILFAVLPPLSPDLFIFSVNKLYLSVSGVPGVRPERFEEGLAVKHCALSLVGEPIMYPEINSFLHLLHQCHISSFLVTNAQFPEEIKWVSKFAHSSLSSHVPYT